MKKIIILFLLVVNTFATPTKKSDFSIILYQPVDIVGKNVVGGVKVMATFIKSVENAWIELEPSLDKRKQSVLVVALGYKRLTSAWIISKNSNRFYKNITKKIRFLKQPVLSNGYFVFALQGAEFKNSESNNFLPTPKDWLDITKKSSKAMIVDEILDKILVKDLNYKDTSPAGFVKQHLKAIGGTILKPKEWFFNETSQPAGYTWILSKENPSVSNYVTGMKIQLLVGIKSGTGKTPKEFAENFLKSKESSFKIIHKYPQTTQNIFSRKGIEVEDKLKLNGKKELYHIVYSAFWNNKNDMLIVVTYGTTKKLWSKYKDIFHTMARFKLLDSI